MFTEIENALLLIASTRAALKNGVKHFSKTGVQLNTVDEILTVLKRDGSIIFDNLARQQITTDEEELVLVAEEFKERLRGFGYNIDAVEILNRLTQERLNAKSVTTN